MVDNNAAAGLFAGGLIMAFGFEVLEHIAIIGSGKGGYTTELNRVSYNGYPAKLDLRKWHEGQPLKGVSLSEDEARALYESLKTIFAEGE